MENVFGIILKVRYDSVGDTASTELLGKTMLDWVRLSLGEAQFAAVEFDENLEVPLQVKHYADASKKYTVVLYSDTPLITKKTVVDAVAVAENGNLNVVRMTRGYVFRTAFLQTCEKLYTENTHYFAEEDFLTANSPHNFALRARSAFFRFGHNGCGRRRGYSRRRRGGTSKYFKGQNGCARGR